MTSEIVSVIKNLEKKDSAISLLHVDDDQDFLELSKIYIEKYSQNIICVESLSHPQNTLQLLNEQDFDIIVSDYMMPNFTGIELLKQLRENGITIPFVMFTGRGREEVAIEALNNGADYYVNKGRDLKSQYMELINLIQKSVKHTRTRQDAVKIEKQFKYLMEKINSGVIIFNQTNQIVFANTYFCEMLGYKKSEIEKTEVQEYLTRDSQEIQTNQQKKLLKGQEERYKLEWITKDNEIVTTIISPTPLFDQKGKFYNSFAVLTDITHIKQNEEKFQETMNWLSHTLHSIGDGVIASNLNGDITFMNEAAENMTGWEFSEAKGSHISKVFHIVNEFTGKKVVNPIDVVLREDIVVGLANHTLLVSRDGRKIPILDSGSPIRDENGQTIGIILVFHDDSERREQYYNIKLENQRLLDIFDCMEDIILIIDYKKRQIIQANEAAKRILGNNIKGKKCHKVFHNVESTCSFCKIPSLDKKDAIIQWECYIPTINRKLRIINKYIEWERKRGTILYIARDITKQEKIQWELQERLKEMQCLFSISKILLDYEASYDQIFLNIIKNIINAWQYPSITHVRIIVFDKDYSNQGFESSRWIQSAPIYINGKREGLIEVFYSEERGEYDQGSFLNEERALLQEIAKKIGHYIEHRILNKTFKEREEEERFRVTFNSIKEGIISLDKKNKIVFMNPMAEELIEWDFKTAQGLPIDNILMLKDKDENDVTKELVEGKVSFDKFSSHLFPNMGLLVLLTPSGNKKDIIISISDIKTDEYLHGKIIVFNDVSGIIKTFEELEKQRKRDTLMLEIIKHDLFNDLVTSKGYIEFLEPFISKETKSFQFLKKAQRKIISILKRIDDIFIIMHDDEDYELNPFNVYTSLKKAEKLVKEYYPTKDIHLVYQNISHDDEVMADPLLDHLFINIFSNSIKHNPEKNVKIKVTKKELHDHLVIKIDDYGPGIVLKDIQKVFERFTSKDKLQLYAGLGLHLVKKLIEKYQGEIEITERIPNDPPKGTRVLIKLRKP